MASQSATSVHINNDGKSRALTVKGSMVGTVSVLEIEADDAAVTLFFWGNPDRQWDDLSALIDAAVTLKRQIVRREAKSLTPCPEHGSTCRKVWHKKATPIGIRFTETHDDITTDGEPVW